MSSFRPASKTKSRLRAAFDGPAGSGKTFTALRGAMVIAASVPGGRVAVINSESGAVEKYLGLAPDGIPFVFDVCELSDFAPTSYTSAILEAGRAGYAALIIDSLSHAWEGVGGALELVDKKRGNSGNSFTAWKDVTPMHRRMIDAILRSPCHVLATMRTKTEYVLEEQIGKSGKPVQVPKRVGMAPIQRAGMEYEFDVVADLDLTHTLTVSKTRCHVIDGMVLVKPGAEFFQPIIEWLNEGVEAPPGYYTASEADLNALEERRAKEERAQAAAAKATEPRIPIETLMARAAGAGNGESSGGGVSGGEPMTTAGTNAPSEPQSSTAAAPLPARPSIGANPPITNTATWAAELHKDMPPNPDDPATASTAQVTRIRDWFKCLEVKPEQAQQAIAKRGANRLRELSWKNADSLIANLVAMGLKLGRAPQTNGHVAESGKEAEPVAADIPF